MRAYLSACTIYRDAASYLAEWIEFHRLMGVERFFLYDNGSADGHREVLAPYVDDGTAVVHDWPMPFVGDGGRGLALRHAFDHCLRAHREDSRWIAFLDIDEFLFSPGGDPLPRLLPDYEEYPGLCVSRAEFGTSGHRARPPGLVIENYVHRRRVKPDDWVPVKSVVDPHRAIVIGPRRLRGQRLSSPDIRAGMAMLIAAVCADGTSEIHNVRDIDRGYERIDERLRGLGAQIERVAA